MITADLSLSAVGFVVLYFIAQEMKCHRLSDEITL